MDPNGRVFDLPIDLTPPAAPTGLMATPVVGHDAQAPAHNRVEPLHDNETSVGAGTSVGTGPSVSTNGASSATTNCGATIRPDASTTWRASDRPIAPIATMRPSLTATSARRRGAPEPSTTVPPATRSSVRSSSTPCGTTG